MRKILINGLLLNGNYSGVQYSIEYFIEAIASLDPREFRFTILVSKNYDGRLKNAEAVTLKRVPFDTSNRLKRILYENIYLPFYFTKGGYYLYHSPGYTLPFFFNLPSIVTVHDLIALDFPELCQSETALYFLKVLPRSIRKSKKIIAVSNTVKRDILTRFPQIDENKISVIYHGIHTRFYRIDEANLLSGVQKKYNLPDKYIFFIGNLEPKKNVVRLIEAFCLLKKQYQIEHQLVIAGRFAWKYAPILDCVAGNSYEDDIKFLGYVDETDLPAIYSLAEVLAFPSIYEGFGLPVLEAMACGCPVIVSDRGALPEISGNHCPVVNPYNIAEIGSGIMKVVSDQTYRDKLVQEGYKWSKAFTWEKAAEQFYLTYAELT